MNWAMDDIKAEIDYRRYGTADRRARGHLEVLRGTRRRRWPRSGRRAS